MEGSVGRARLVLAALIGTLVAALAGLPGLLLVPTTPVTVAAATATSLLLGAAAGLALVRPGVALAVAWAGAVAQMLGTLPVLPIDVGILLVVAATGASATRVVRLLGLGSAVLGALVAAVYLAVPGVGYAAETQFTVGLLIGFATLVTLVLSWTFGVLLATIRRARQSRAAATLAQREAIAEQERGRIARDMHDVVAHSLAVIVAQADGARYLAEHDPARTRDSLATISTTAREALGDVRVLLARLRHQQGALPQPGLDELDALVEQCRSAGLAVEAEIAPAPGGVPAGVQLALYRILQESLTNALRHADRAHPVRVAVGWDDAGARLEVGSRLVPEAHSDGPGHGLTGMRERARLVGGTLTAGPVGDEFVVVAVLPVLRAAAGS